MSLFDGAGFVCYHTNFEAIHSQYLQTIDLLVVIPESLKYPYRLLVRWYTYRVH